MITSPAVPMIYPEIIEAAKNSTCTQILTTRNEMALVVMPSFTCYVYYLVVKKSSI